MGGVLYLCGDTQDGDGAGVLSHSFLNHGAELVKGDYSFRIGIC